MGLKVGLLGGGSWGTTVAALVARNTQVTIWARDAATVTEINEKHSNEKYLPGATLPASLRAANTIEETVADIDVLVVGIPSQGFRAVVEQVNPICGRGCRSSA
jgi:glycerol-3-phosphate dehydrogenase (NAD(P)+)